MPRVVENQSRTCYYPHEQCSMACAQWTRMIDSMLSSKTHIRSPCLARPTADPALTRLVQAEWANRNNKQLNNNSEGEQLERDGVMNESDANGEVNCHSIKPLLTQVPYKDGGQKEAEHTSPSSRRGLTPWKDIGKCYSAGLQGLHEEIEDFYTYMRPFPEEQYMRNDIIARLTQIVNELWSNAEVQVFGSFKTDLYLPTSDLDLVVMCDDVDHQTALKMLEQKLIEKKTYDDIKVIRTSVPIVKFTDRKTAVKVDVSFNVQTGLSSAQFIRSMTLEYPELPYLVLVLKQFLLYRNLLESFNGGISSYCLILLIVSYLQLHPEDRCFGNYGDMLIKFFELYGRHFNYLRTGIRISNGGSYFRKNENDGEVGNRYSLLCIEDPFNPENDVGEGCYGAMKVREEFDKAYRELSDAVLPQYRHVQPVGSSFLGRILLFPPEIIQYRQIVRERYQNHVIPSNHATLNNHQYLILNSPHLNNVGTTTTFNGHVCSDDRSDADSVSSNNSRHSNRSVDKSSNSSCSGSSILSETESDVQSDVTKNLINDSSRQVKSTIGPPSSSLLERAVEACRITDNDFRISHHAVVSVPSPPFTVQPPSMLLSERRLQHQQQQPTSTTRPSQQLSNEPLTMTQPNGGGGGGGRNNLWHYHTFRSQGPKSQQRTTSSTTTTAGNIGGQSGNRTYVLSSRYHDRRRNKNQSHQHESNNCGGGGGGADVNIR